MSDNHPLFEQMVREVQAKMPDSSKAEIEGSFKKYMKRLTNANQIFHNFLSLSLESLSEEIAFKLIEFRVTLDQAQPDNDHPQANIVPLQLIEELGQKLEEILKSDLDKKEKIKKLITLSTDVYDLLFLVNETVKGGGSVLGPSGRSLQQQSDKVDHQNNLDCSCCLRSQLLQ